jgi:esterase/lipase superfamily enzyme/Tfp pilus assembly protein PilF
MARAAVERVFCTFVLACCMVLAGSSAIAQGNDAAEIEKQLNQLFLDYKYADGATLAEQYVESAKTSSGEDSLQYAAAANWLGVFRQATSRYRDAQSLHERALSIREKRLGPENVAVAESLENLAVTYDSQAQTSAAEPLFKRALAIRELQLGSDDPLVATSLSDLGMFYIYTQARYDDAAPLLNRALAIRSKVLGANDRATATSLLYLAKLSHERGAYSEADRLYRQALATYEAAVGPEHPEVARTLLNLATLYVQQGRTADAENHLQRALAIYEKTLGRDDERAALCLNSLSNLYRMQGRFAEAEPLVVRSLGIQEKLLGPDHPDVARTLTNLGALYQVQGHFAAAEEHYLRALAIREKRLGPKNPEVGVTLTKLAAFYQYLGRNDNAEDFINRAIQIRRAALGEKHADVGLSISVLAGIYEKKGQRKAAETHYRKALEIQEAALGPDQLEVAMTKHNLGALYKADGQLSEANLYLRAAFAIREKQLAADHPAILDSMIQLAELYRLQGQPEEARKLFDRARALGRSGLKEIPVFFGTDRGREEHNGSLTFGNERAAKGLLTLGVTKVTLPALMKSANSEPFKDESTNVGRLAIQPIEIREQSALLELVGNSLLQSRIFKGHAFVFIHGYNVSFENAVRRAGQIAYDLNFDGAAFLFSWPSRGQLFGYLADRDEVDLAAEHLKQFLKNIVLAGKASKVHLVAHSMGNMVLLRALEKMREDSSADKLPLGQIITAAPDVDPDLYAQFAAKAMDRGAHVTLYVSADDKALWLSSWLKSRTRAGYVNGTPVPITGAETIDITGVPSATFFALNHDVYASTPVIVGDMRGVLLGEGPPDVRTKELHRISMAQGVYWKYQAATQTGK